MVDSVPAFWCGIGTRAGSWVVQHGASTVGLHSKGDTGLPNVVEQGGLNSAQWGEEVGATQKDPLHWHEEDPGLLETEEICISTEA